MPVDAYCSDNWWTGLIINAKKGQAGNDRYYDDPCKNVQTMEPGKREKTGPKYAAADGNMIIQQAQIFAPLPKQKDTAK